MSAANGNGVIRVGRKGTKKFAFGNEGEPGSEPFSVDVVVAYQAWICTDNDFREQVDPTGGRTIPTANMPEYNRMAKEFVQSLAAGGPDKEPPEITTAEALDFIARLRECYDEVAIFFLAKSPEERASRDTSEVELQFSVEGEPQRN